MVAAPIAGNELNSADADRRDEFLRTRVDVLRGRQWVLGIDHVGVYDIADKHLIRNIVLPGWNVVDFLCPPDMVIDRSGAALISSNIVPTLWRIDADDFTVSRRQIQLTAKENWDIGFSGLTFAADGTLFGVTALPGSLWRIDINSATAAAIELSQPLRGACSLTASKRVRTGALNPQLSLCVIGRHGIQRIDLSPDITSGHVSAEPCDGLREANE